jgi:asparagine synthase (glutamine-hydrolysing)
MSGFVGIVRLNGTPVDRKDLERLAEFQKFRGPDAERIWIDGHVGLAHALLRTNEDSSLDRQPFQLGDGMWIAADARMDDRPNLVAALTASGERPAPDAGDGELILRSYRAWGASCVDRLLGDFAFAIWDGPNQRLFCARDHMGVKPLYYAQVGSLLVFSNTFECVRRHPAVSGRLNDLAIADFLLFDINQDPSTTAFADIHRLPAAHVLQCEGGTVSIRRYWTLCVIEPVELKKDSEYIERFRELLDMAVADRLRSKSAGILMSGGLDSTTVAASARRILAARGVCGGLFANTVVIPQDCEREYASLAGDALGIPIQFRTAEPSRLFEDAENAEFRTSYPEHSAWPDQTPYLLRQVGANSRIALTGSGSDPGLSSRITAHFRQRLGNRQFARAVTDALRYLGAEGRLSRLYLRGRWNLLFKAKNSFQTYPCWLNLDFEREWKLADRWKLYGVPDRATALRSERGVAAVRPEAFLSIAHVSWQDQFESLDAGATRVPVEVRHPFFDLRMITFLLRLPRLPWCCDKELLRRAARGILPDSVRLRRKSPLERDPIIDLLRKQESEWVDRFEPVSELARYVRRDRIPPVWKGEESGAAWVNLKPLSLNFWLRMYQK